MHVLDNATFDRFRYIYTAHVYLSTLIITLKELYGADIYCE